MSDEAADRRRLVLFTIAVLGTALICFAPQADGLRLEGQYSLATLFFAALPAACWPTHCRSTVSTGASHCG